MGTLGGRLRALDDRVLGPAPLPATPLEWRAENRAWRVSAVVGALQYLAVAALVALPVDTAEGPALMLLVAAAASTWEAGHRFAEHRRLALSPWLLGRLRPRGVGPGTAAWGPGPFPPPAPRSRLARLDDRFATARGTPERWVGWVGRWPWRVSAGALLVLAGAVAVDSRGVVAMIVVAPGLVLIGIGGAMRAEHRWATGEVTLLGRTRPPGL